MSLKVYKILYNIYKIGETNIKEKIRGSYLEKEDEVYKKLQQRLDELPFGFPPTESGIEIRLLKRLFTPDEANIALNLKFSLDELEPIESIYDRLKGQGYSFDELEAHLDNMAKKGAILGIKKEGKKLYSIVVLPIIYDFQVDKLTKGFINDMRLYIKERWAVEAAKTRVQNLRVIPIEKSIEPNLLVANYDDVRDLIEIAEEPFIVMNCVCRQTKDLLNEPCKATPRRKICLGFGDKARFYLEYGWGDQISKEDVFSILKQNQSENLILQTGNAQKIEILCSCCTCCCASLGSLTKLPNPSDFVVTNHYAVVDPDKCVGCGICVEICKLNARSLVDHLSLVNEKRCIGCGNCVAECPSEATKLCKKDKAYVPFLTLGDLYNDLLESRKLMKERERKRLLRKRK